MRSAIIAVICCLLLCPVAFAQNSERITSFDSAITVARDGTLDVVETIAVHSEGIEIHHGIYRDFPTSYADQNGHDYRIGFRVVDVQRDGQAEPYHTAGMSNGQRIYIGSRNVTLSPGDYTYRLHYQVTRELGFYDAHDELYWNVTGNGWVFPIESATATVTLPEKIDTSEIGVEAYTGPQGAQGRAYAAKADADGHASFNTTRPLGSYEGLTIVVTFPKGIVDEQAAKRGRALINLPSLDADAPANRVALLIILVVLAYYVTTWYFVGRDLPKGVVVPQWIPPEGLSPAALRYIVKEGFDTKTLTAAIISLAVKRYIKIMENDGLLSLSKTYTLKPLVPKDEVLIRRMVSTLTPGHAYRIGDLAARTMDSADTVQGRLEAAIRKGFPIDLANGTATLRRGATLGLAEHVAPATPEELEIYDQLFPSGSEGSIAFTLENANYQEVQLITKQLSLALKTLYEGKLFLSNTGYRIAGVVISIILFVCMLLWRGNPGMGGGESLFSLVFLIPVIIAVASIASQVRRVTQFQGCGAIGAIFTIGFFVVWGGGFFLGFLAMASSGSDIGIAALPVIGVAVALVVINVLFYHLLKAPTFSGRRVMDAAEGFRMYLSVAEKDRLNLENPPNKTPELFEQFLPYALALDVEQQWAEQFNAIFADLRAQGQEYQPVWYAGGHFHDFSSNAGSFASSLGNNLGNAISSSSTAPGSSSGSGGGGSSGGGGGGGGGGGW
jgi:uncharacterized membrane protein YgcG